GAHYVWEETHGMSKKLFMLELEPDLRLVRKSYIL
ncbi:MAG: hypothetical protein HW401_756, partial [Parcubacteria group bacterium]|nr:hypothetical protein [Parcubacteria group bacterium]